jgi:histidinol-phosphate aminotransferase
MFQGMGHGSDPLGFAVSPHKIIRALHSVRSPYNVDSLTQAAGCVILSNHDYIKKAVEEIKKSRDYLYQGLAELEETKEVIRVIKPDTNFVLMDAKMQNPFLRTEKAFHHRSQTGQLFENYSGDKEGE